MKLYDAIKLNKKDIILESTGEVFPEWLFDSSRFKNIKKFKIILIWFIAPFNDLIDRNINRSIKTMKDYIYYDKEHKKYKINDMKLPPRLPNTNTSIYKQKLSNIINTFNNKNEIIEKLRDKGYNIDVKIYYNPNKKSNIKYIKDNAKSMKYYMLK